MTTKTVGIAAGSTKFLLLCQFVKKQHTSASAAFEARLLDGDFARRTRELAASGYIERTGKIRNGRPVFRVTPEGRAVCRRFKRLDAKS